MNEFCKQCGSCCNVVTLQSSYREMKKVARREHNTRSCSHFIVHNFLPINKKIGYMLNPYLKEVSNSSQFFYICKKFKDGKCLIHGMRSRPYTCTRYPFYSNTSEKLKSILETFRYSENCGYYTGKAWERLKELQIEAMARTMNEITEAV